MKKFNFFLLVLVSFLCGCQLTSLNISNFIEDKNSPGLPEYSEWGYNTFGAYIDRATYVSVKDQMPAKIIVSADTFHLRLNGNWGYAPLVLKFSIKGYNPATYSALTSLNDSIFNLAAKEAIVTMIYQGKSRVLNIFEGELHFKRVQKLYVDKQLQESILSGTFNFKTFIDGEPVAISDGRFDFGIGYDSFYKF